MNAFMQFSFLLKNQTVQNPKNTQFTIIQNGEKARDHHISEAGTSDC